MTLDGVTWVSSFESKHSISIILCLYDNGILGKTELYNMISRNANMPEKIRILEDLGILQSDTRFNTTLISLIEVGKLVAEQLMEINDILNSSNRSDY